MIAILWGRFVAWISPFLVPLLLALLTLATIWGVWQHVEINGLHINLFGWRVAVIEGYIEENAKAKADLVTAKTNQMVLQKAVDDQNAAIKKAAADGAKHDADTNRLLADLAKQAAEADAKARILNAMVGNAKYGKDAETRAKAIIRAGLGK